MLGSLHDAEDAVQESLVRAWRGVGGLDERGFVRAWLYKIATNRCLTALDRSSRRELPVDVLPGTPETEVSWLEPYPGQSPEASYLATESVELAFIAALQHLPGKQRAVLILRDVLGFSAREVADTLGASPASVDSALQRAHKSVERRLPAQSQQATLRALGDKRLGELVGSYVDAWERGDVEAIVAMLAEDARITMPPIPTWFSGRDAIAAFLAERVLRGDRPRRLLAVRANGSPAFGQYAWNEDKRRLVAHGITVLTFQGERIEQITAFLNPEAFVRFGLPSELSV
jgi:RNA polymerase sigma-70 factor (ECF subfamily)